MAFRKETLLFIILGGFFIANALIAEMIGVKIFSLEGSLGIAPARIQVLGYSLSFNLTAGVLLWPVVFVMTDVINEYYGKRGVRILSFLAAGLIAYAFLMIYMAMSVEPAEFWLKLPIYTDKQLDINEAFNSVFGQGLWIIAGSLTAFLVGQIVDVTVFHKLRRYTGASRIWLRATGSTLVSQLVDSFVVLFIAFYIGADWPLSQVLAVGLVNYMYKFLMALGLTPLLYGVHALIDAFLGKELAHQLMEDAARSEREKD